MSRLFVYESTGKGKTVLSTREGITSVTDIDNNGYWVHPPIFYKPPRIESGRFRPNKIEEEEQYFFILAAQSGTMNNVGLKSKLYLFSEEDNSYFVVPDDPKNLVYDSHRQAIYNQELDTESLNFLYSNNFRYIVSDSFPAKFMHYDGETGAFGKKTPAFYTLEKEITRKEFTPLYPYDHILDEEDDYKYYNIPPVINRNKEYYGVGLYVKNPRKEKSWVGLHDYIPFLRQFIVCNYFTITGIFENLGGGNLVWTGDYIALGETPQGISKGMSYFYPYMHSHPANNYGINADGEEYLNTLRNNHTVNSGGTFYSDGISYTPDGIMRPNMLRHFTSNPLASDLTNREGTWSIRWNFSHKNGMYPYYEPGDPLPVYDTSSRLRNFPDFIPSTNYTEVSNWIPSVPYYYEVDRNPPPIFFVDTQSVVFDDPNEEKIIRIVSYRIGNPTVNIKHLNTIAISNHTPHPIYSPPTDEFFELSPKSSIPLPTGEIQEIKIKLKPKIKTVISNYYTSHYELSPSNDPLGVNSISITLHWAPPQIRYTLDMVEMRQGDRIKQRIFNNFCPCIVDNTEYDFYFQLSSYIEDVEVNLECINQPDKFTISANNFTLTDTELSEPITMFWRGDPVELEFNTFTDVIIKASLTSKDENYNGKTFYYIIRVYPSTPSILWDTRSDSALFGFLHFESSDEVYLEINRFIRPLGENDSVSISFQFPDDTIVQSPPSFTFNQNNWNKKQSILFKRNPSSYKLDTFQTADIVMKSTTNPSFNEYIGKLFVCTRYPISYSNSPPITIRNESSINNSKLFNQ